MIEIFFQRTFRIVVSEARTRLRPSNMMEPPTIRPFDGSSLMRASAVVVFPQPDSPASPMASPSRRSNEAPLTAWTAPARVPNSTERSRTSRRVRSSPPEARVHDLIEGVSEEVEAEDEDDETQARYNHPFGHSVCDCIVSNRLRDDPSPTHVVPDGEVEEREDAFRENRNGNGEDSVREDDGKGIRQDVTDHDVGAGRADHPSAFDEHPLLEAQHLASDDSRGHGPAGKSNHEDNPPEVEVANAGGDDNHEDEEGDREHHVVEAHDHLVEPTPDKPGDEADPRPDHNRHKGRHDPDDQRDLGAPDHLRVDVATQEVHAERMLWAGVRERQGVRDWFERPVGGTPGGADREDEKKDEDPEAQNRGPIVQHLRCPSPKAASQHNGPGPEGRDNPDLPRNFAHEAPQVILIRGSRRRSTKSEIRFAMTTAAPPMTIMNWSRGKSRFPIASIVRYPMPL